MVVQWYINNNTTKNVYLKYREYMCINNYYELNMLFKHQCIGFSNWKSLKTKNQTI